MGCGLKKQSDHCLAAWPAPTPAREHRRKKIESQWTQTTAAIPASVSCTGPMRCPCSTDQGITGRWITQLQLLRYPSLVAEEKKSNNKTGNNMEKKCLKALLAPSQGVQRLPGCISEQLVWALPSSFTTRCLCNADSSSTTAEHWSTYLNFNYSPRTSEGKRACI